MSKIDIPQIEELIAEYQRADERKTRREIENEILDLTAWNEDAESAKDGAFAVFNKRQWERITDSVEVVANHKEVERLLRSPYVKEL
jgi:hypothetical protein